MADGSEVVYRWRRKLRSEDGPHPTVRHILVTLSLHMDIETGDNSFPGVREIAKETGLSQRTVIDRLDQADAEGWVRRVCRRGKRGKYRQYLPAIPGEVLRESQQLERTLIREGAERISAPLAAEDASGGAEIVSEGAEASSKKVLRGLQQSSSRSSSKSSSKSSSVRVRFAEDVPDGWKPPEELLDRAVLFGLLNGDGRRLAHGFIDGDDWIAIANPSDLDLISPANLRIVQYHAAMSREAAA